MKKISPTILILGILSLAEILMIGEIRGTVVLWFLYGIYKVEWLD